MTKREKAEKLGLKATKAAEKVVKFYDKGDALEAKIEEMKNELARLRHVRGKASEAAAEASEAHRLALNEADEEQLDDPNWVGSRHHY